MSYLRALYDNFEFFRKIIFSWGRIFENRGAVSEISTNFQSENGFNSQNIGESIFKQSFGVAVKMSPLLPLII